MILPAIALAVGAKLAIGYLATQATFALAETAIEVGATSWAGGEVSAGSAAETFGKNFAINVATGGIGTKAKLASRVGLYALRQGIEIGGDTAFDVGWRGQDFRSSLAINTAGSLIGEAAGRVAIAGARRALSRGSVDDVLRAAENMAAPTPLSSVSDAVRQRVLANIANSQAARASSNFTHFDRRVVARQFYGDAGFSGGRLEAHLQGIDFSKPVTVQTIPQGAFVEQWVKGGKVGNYFAPLGQAPEKNGIFRGMRTPIAFQANQNVQVLQSYAAPIKDTWTLGANYPVMTPGGGVQYFAPNHNSFDIIFGW
jgi:hypothetical protein